MELAAEASVCCVTSTDEPLDGKRNVYVSFGRVLSTCKLLLQNPSSPMRRAKISHTSSDGSSLTRIAIAKTGCSSGLQSCAQSRPNSPVTMANLPLIMFSRVASFAHVLASPFQQSTDGPPPPSTAWAPALSTASWKELHHCVLK